MAYPQTLGKYRLLKRLARGGMGEVWSAEAIDDPSAPRVAVKAMLSPEDADTSSLAKFIAEARIGAAVSNHPHIVRTLDLGLEGDRMFIVMELLEGRPLSQLARATQLPVEAAIGIALPVLDALDHAQRAPGPNREPLHLVHRDLKPGNLFITQAGVVKVIDFGIALASGLDQTTTRTGLIRGSISYVSPEQARGERSDGRSDIYSLAVVLHELLTGRRLFDQPSDAARLSAILFNEVPTVRSLRAEVPQALDDAVMHALARDPAQRPADARAFAEALKRSIAPAQPWGPREIAAWAEARQVAIVRSPATGPIVEEVVKRRATPYEVQVVLPPRRTPWVMLVVSFAVATMAGIGLYAVLTMPSAPPRVEVVQPPAPPPPPPEPPQPAPVVVAPPAEPEAKPEPPAEPAPAKPAVARPAKPPASNAVVYVTIDSRPSWANISVDGRDLGPTPLVRVPLPLSSRALTAVNPDGKKRVLKLKLVEGKDEKVLLEW
jgi:serine/threonine-protein kinase